MIVQLIFIPKNLSGLILIKRPMPKHGSQNA